MSMETTAQQAFFQARLFLHAVNAPGPWTMQWAGIVVPAPRTRTSTQVSFRADFPAACFLERPTGLLTLTCDGEPMGFKPVEHPGDTDGDISVVWQIYAEEPVRG